MNIVNGKKYSIKHSPALAAKYGVANPVIKIEGRDKDVFGRSWMNANGNPAALGFAVRTGFEHIDGADDSEVYYGKINGMGELVYAAELEEINSSE